MHGVMCSQKQAASYTKQSYRESAVEGEWHELSLTCVCLAGDVANGSSAPDLNGHAEEKSPSAKLLPRCDARAATVSPWRPAAMRSESGTSSEALLSMLQ